RTRRGTPVVGTAQLTPRSFVEPGDQLAHRGHEAGELGRVAQDFLAAGAPARGVRLLEFVGGQYTGMRMDVLPVRALNALVALALGHGFARDRSGHRLGDLFGDVATGLLEENRGLVAGVLAA